MNNKKVNIIYLSISLFHLCIIFFCVILLDIYNSLAFSSIVMLMWLILLLFSFLNKTTAHYLTDVMSISQSRDFEDAFMNSVSLIEKLGNIVFIATGLSYVMGIQYYSYMAIVFLPLYFGYLIFWIVYFKKYHISLIA